MKLVRKIVIILAILLVALVAARNIFLKSAATKAIEQSTGFGVEMDKFKVGLFKPTFEIRGLHLVNPEDFPDARAIDIDRFYVRYDLPSLLTDEVHLYEVVMDIPKVVVVQKESGETNMERLANKSREAVGKGKRKQEGGSREKDVPEGERAEPMPSEPAPDVEPPTPEPEKPAKKMRIDTLTVKLGEAEVRRYSREEPKPEIKRYPIDRERTYENITSSEQIVNAVVAEVVAYRIQRQLRDLADEHQEDIDKAAKKLDEVSEGLGKSLKGLIKDVAGEE